MEQGVGTRTRAALAAVSLLMCIACPGYGEAESFREARGALDSGGAKSVRLSLKIAGAKKRKRLVSFYKSVARQGKIRPTCDRNPSSAR